jgi:hypothetical protein
MRDIPIEEWGEWRETWVNSLPPEYQAIYSIAITADERSILREGMRYIPVEEWGELRKTWINSLPPEYQAINNNDINEDERSILIDKMRYIPVEEWGELRKTWINSLPSEYRVINTNNIIVDESDIIIDKMGEMPIEQWKRMSQTWFNSLLPAYRALQERELLEPEVPLQELEESQLRQQHHNRVNAIISKQHLGIDIPDQSTQEWTNFATNLIVEYESERLPVVKDKETGEMFTKDRSKPLINSQGRQLKDEDLEILKDENGEILTEERGIGSARFLGDILIGGTTDGVDPNERERDEYKDLMNRVFIRWQIHKIEQNIIQEKHLDIEAPDRSTQEWKDFATFIRGVYKKYATNNLASRRVLEDYLGGGIDIEISLNKIRQRNEYKKLMAWVLKSWRDRQKGE